MITIYTIRLNLSSSLFPATKLSHGFKTVRNLMTELADSRFCPPHLYTSIIAGLLSSD